MAPFAKSNWQDRVRAAQISTVAVLPLENLSDDNYASDIVSGALSTALYGAKRFKVIEHREALRKLQSQNRTLPKILGKSAALEAGKALGVDGVFYGTITEFMYLFYPEDAVVGIRLSLVDVTTEQVVWSGVFNHRSQGLLQGSNEPITDLARQGVSVLVGELVPNTQPGMGGVPAQHLMQTGDATPRQ